VLTYAASGEFLRRYPSMCWYELRRSFSRALFCRSLQRLVPEIQPDDLAAGWIGRARASHRAGRRPGGRISASLSEPTRSRTERASPAATASLAIGAEIASMVPAAG